MELTPEILLNAYCQGIFPMAEDDGTIYWYDPDPRTIIPLEDFHIPRSLRQRMRKGGYEVRFSTAFRQVMAACAEPSPGREQTWISTDLIDVYTQLFDMGYAHSVEIWINEELMGGLYGVAIGGLFAGESMFSRVTDASKLALVYLVDKMQEVNSDLLDVQFMTEHLRRFGAIEISRDEYQQRLKTALRI